MKRTNKIYEIIITLVFLICILIPFANDIFRFYIPPKISKSENRTLATKPIFNVTLLDPYPGAYERYFKDDFVYRQQELKAHSFINFFYFNRSPVPDEVDVGKNGWLYYGSKDRLIYKGKMNLSGEKLQKIVTELHKRAVYYHSKGAHFYVCFAPMKQDIYPEFLPNDYFRSPGGTQTDKVIAAIQKDPLISFVDLKTSLLDAKKHGIVYQKTDHHWNFFGAFFVYSSIINRIKKDFPKIKPLTLKDMKFDRVVSNGGTLANMIGYDDKLKDKNLLPTIKNAKATAGKKAGYPPPYWFGNKNEYEVVFVTQDTTMPKLFVVRDSFFNLPMIYFRENFRKTVAIWDAWMYGNNKSLIEKENPDIVLLMIYEENIPNILFQPIY